VEAAEPQSSWNNAEYDCQDHNRKQYGSVHFLEPGGPGKWAGSCNGAAWLRLRGTADGGCVHRSWVAPCESQKPHPVPQTARDKGWGTRLDWAVKLVVIVRL
jgi:hypothetical protein